MEKIKEQVEQERRNNHVGGGGGFSLLVAYLYQQFPHQDFCVFWSCSFLHLASKKGTLDPIQYLQDLFFSKPSILKRQKILGFREVLSFLLPTYS